MIARIVEVFPDAWRARLDAAGLLLLRVVFGGVMVYGHGWGKLSGYSELSAGFPDPLGVGSALSAGLAVFAEFFCGLALVFGLFTRLATIPLIVTMGIAFFVIHADDPFGRKELSLVYLGAFLVILAKGAGAWSIDALLTRRSKGSA